VEYDRLRGTEYSRFHGYTYDGIWAAALAIQYVAEKREDLLTHFDYRVKDWESVFLEALRNTSFEGVTVNELQNTAIYQILIYKLYHIGSCAFLQQRTQGEYPDQSVPVGSNGEDWGIPFTKVPPGLEFGQAS